jgi:hypothetical protein
MAYSHSFRSGSSSSFYYTPPPLPPYLLSTDPGRIPISLLSDDDYSKLVSLPSSSSPSPPPSPSLSLTHSSSPSPSPSPSIYISPPPLPPPSLSPFIYVSPSLSPSPSIYISPSPSSPSPPPSSSIHIPTSPSPSPSPPPSPQTPFISILSFLENLEVKSVPSTPTSSFRVRKQRILLVFQTSLELSTIERYYFTKMANYEPQIWAVHAPVGHTCVLIFLTNDDGRRFDTKNKNFFDFSSSNPEVFPIDGRGSLWGKITEFLNVSTTQCALRGPDSFQTIRFLQPWQANAFQWLNENPLYPATAPILNLQSRSQLGAMIDFYKWMLYHHYQDTLVFTESLPGKQELIKELQSSLNQGWSGKWIIIMMGHESFHSSEVWSTASLQLQQLCDGKFTNWRPPVGILILSLKPITNGALDTRHVEVVKLEGKFKDAPSEGTLAKTLFHGRVRRPKHELGSLPPLKPPPEPFEKGEVPKDDPSLLINKPINKPMYYTPPPVPPYLRSIGPDYVPPHLLSPEDYARLVSLPSSSSSCDECPR